MMLPVTSVLSGAFRDLHVVPIDRTEGGEARMERKEGSEENSGISGGQ